MSLLAAVAKIISLKLEHLMAKNGLEALKATCACRWCEKIQEVFASCSQPEVNYFTFHLPWRSLQIKIYATGEDITIADNKYLDEIELTTRSSLINCSASHDNQSFRATRVIMRR